MVTRGSRQLVCLLFGLVSTSAWYFSYEKWYENTFNNPFDLKWFPDNHFRQGFPFFTWEDTDTNTLKTELPKEVEWISYFPNPG